MVVPVIPASAPVAPLVEATSFGKLGALRLSLAAQIGLGFAPVLPRHDHASCEVDEATGLELVQTEGAGHLIWRSQMGHARAIRAKLDLANQYGIEGA